MLQFLALLVVTGLPLDCGLEELAGSCAEVEIAQEFLVGKGPSVAGRLVAVHKNGGVAVRPPLRPMTVTHLGDSENGAETGVFLPISEGSVAGLADGRIIAKVDEDRYELWEWDGSSKARLLEVVQSENKLAAAICRVAPPGAAQSRGVSNLLCVGGHLVGNVKDFGVVVWRKGRWLSTGARLDLRGHSLTWRGGGQLGLYEHEFDAAHSGLARFSIPHVTAPKNVEQISCGSRACWAADRDGELFVLDLRATAHEWRRLGRTGRTAHTRYPSFEFLGYDERAVLGAGDACCYVFYYLKLPALDAGLR